MKLPDPGEKKVVLQNAGSVAASLQVFSAKLAALRLRLKKWNKEALSFHHTHFRRNEMGRVTHPYPHRSAAPFLLPKVERDARFENVFMPRDCVHKHEEL